MKLYLVRNRNGDYLYVEYGYLFFWGPKDKASIYHTQVEAQWSGQCAFDWRDDVPEAHFDIVEIDTDAALEVLRDLFGNNDLDDAIYGMLEPECQGWKRPLLAKWCRAVQQAKKLLKEGVE